MGAAGRPILMSMLERLAGTTALINDKLEMVVLRSCVHVSERQLMEQVQLGVIITGVNHVNDEWPRRGRVYGKEQRPQHGSLGYPSGAER